MKINERFIWAVSVISPSPRENILEIGCGAGILTEQIALQLKSGSITAIDKSKPMMKLAARRNKAHVDGGKVKLVTADFAKTTLAEYYFDKIAAYNVNFFWKDPVKELALIAHCLKPKGKLFVFYQTPPWADPGIANQIKLTLEQNKYSIVDTVYKQEPEASFCIIAQYR